MVNLFQHYYFGHGKFLLSAEYFVMFGAKGVGLPTNLGQSLAVRFRRSYRPTLKWESYDRQGHCWYRAEFELWRFQETSGASDSVTLFLQKLLIEARKLNPHFLRDEQSILAQTQLEFPLSWGLGSSSTLIYNVSQWAYVSPFALFFACSQGSGYDVACAQAKSPISYQLVEGVPHYQTVEFRPSFSNRLYFVYTGKKQITAEEIKKFIEYPPAPNKIDQINELSAGLLSATSAAEFCDLMRQHEELVGSYLGRTPVQKERFPDFPGQIKSLGAWGGDFVLACSPKSATEDVKRYFELQGINLFFEFDELVSMPSGGQTWQQTIQARSDISTFQHWGANASSPQ